MNLQGGRTRDGGSIVGASVFYTTSRPEGEEKGEGEMPEKTTCTEVDMLDRELKVFVQLHFHAIDMILKMEAVCCSRMMALRTRLQSATICLITIWTVAAITALYDQFLKYVYVDAWCIEDIQTVRIRSHC